MFRRIRRRLLLGRPGPACGRVWPSGGPAPWRGLLRGAARLSQRVEWFRDSGEFFYVLFEASLDRHVRRMLPGRAVHGEPGPAQARMAGSGPPTETGRDVVLVDVPALSPKGLFFPLTTCRALPQVLGPFATTRHGPWLFYRVAVVEGTMFTLPSTPRTRVGFSRSY